MDIGENEIKKLALDSENDTNSAIKASSSDGKMDTEESGEVTAVENVNPAEENSVSMEMEDESVFKLTISEQSSQNLEGTGDKVVIQEPMNIFMPPPRMNAVLTVKSSQLFLYGGIFEVGDKQYTLSDFYSLDISKLEEWTTIIECDLKDQVCFFVILLQLPLKELVTKTYFITAFAIFNHFCAINMKW